MGEFHTTESDDKTIVRFTGDVFCNFYSPCIYIWKRGEQYLYIGSSMHGFSRVFEAKHHIFDARRIKPTDTIEIRLYQSPTEHSIRLLEKTMIEKYNPKFNGGSKGKKWLKSEEEKAIKKIAIAASTLTIPAKGKFDLVEIDISDIIELL